MSNHFGNWTVAYDLVLAENCYRYEPQSMEEFNLEAAEYAAPRADELTLRGMLSPGVWEPTASALHWDAVGRASWTGLDDEVPF